MRDLRKLGDTPLYVPHYIDANQIRIPPDTLWSHPREGRSTSHTLTPQFREQFLPPGAELVRYAFLNRYEDHDLQYHQDNSGPKVINSVIALQGIGPLGLLQRARRKPWIIILHPGDAIFWNTTCERAGWYHGGPTGTRTSIVLRFQLKSSRQVRTELLQEITV